MNVGLAIESFRDARHLAENLVALDRRMRLWFVDRAYGNSVDNIFIGVLLIPGPGKKFHPPRQFKYQRKLKMTVDGNAEVMSNVVSFDVDLDYEMLMSMDVDVAVREINAVIVSSIERVLAVNEKTIQEFDRSLFIADLKKIVEVQP